MIACAECEEARCSSVQTEVMTVDLSASFDRLRHELGGAAAELNDLEAGNRHRCPKGKILCTYVNALSYDGMCSVAVPDV